ncbi:MAG: hypothetical protein ABIH67_05700 [Candidatus Uhrbacteria bacterium]
MSKQNFLNRNPVLVLESRVAVFMIVTGLIIMTGLGLPMITAWQEGGVVSAWQWVQLVAFLYWSVASLIFMVSVSNKANKIRILEDELESEKRSRREKDQIIQELRHMVFDK